jgi:Cytochrome c7 and related cytochrome c
MNVANEVEYIATDDKRQVIPWVRVKNRQGQVREFSAPGVTPEQLAKGERRRMDCMDCHNRPSHPMAATPERAVDDMIARGSMPRTLPFVRRETVKALKVAYPTQDAAGEGISRTLREFYRSQFPQAYMAQRQDVERAVQSADAIYRRNVFPEMNIQFGTYPNNIGHMDFPGCFRCHDDGHVAKDGTKITQDCDSCHKIE